MINELISAIKEYVSNKEETDSTYVTKNTKQEKEVESLLEKHGLKKLGEGSEDYKNRKSEDVGFYVQPNGAQDTPDILIVNRIKELPVDCKSSKQRVCFNSTKPKKGTVYLIANGKYRCVLLGEEVSSGEEESLICEEYETKLKALSQETNEKLGLLESDLYTYPRKAYYTKKIYKETNRERIEQHIQTTLKINTESE